MVCFVHNGKNLNQICKEKCICYNTVFYGVERGLSLENAIQNAISRKHRKDNNCKIYINGECLKEFCRKNNINYSNGYFWFKRKDYEKLGIKEQDISEIVTNFKTENEE